MATYREDSECTCDEPQPPYGHFVCALHGWPEECGHDWQPYWDGSLGYRATDWCGRCGIYRPTPAPEHGQLSTPHTEQETTNG